MFILTFDPPCSLYCLIRTRCCRACDHAPSPNHAAALHRVRCYHAVSFALVALLPAAGRWFEGVTHAAQRHGPPHVVVHTFEHAGSPQITARCALPHRRHSYATTAQGSGARKGARSETRAFAVSRGLRARVRGRHRPNWGYLVKVACGRAWCGGCSLRGSCPCATTIISTIRLQLATRRSTFPLSNRV